MPYKGLLLANSSRGTEFYFACILCPTARKRTITITGSLLPVGGFIACHESVSSFCKSWSANLSLTPAWRLFLFYSLPRHSLFYSPGSAGGCLCWPKQTASVSGTYRPESRDCYYHRMTRVNTPDNMSFLVIRWYL